VVVAFRQRHPLLRDLAGVFMREWKSFLEVKLTSKPSSDAPAGAHIERNQAKSTWIPLDGERITTLTLHEIHERSQQAEGSRYGSQYSHDRSQGKVCLLRFLATVLNLCCSSHGTPLVAEPTDTTRLKFPLITL
jgi:hypothetical protein